MGNKASIARALLTQDRRSVMKYKGPCDPTAIKNALTAAIHAPNHWVNEPWRFRLLGAESKEALCAKNPGKKKMFDQVPQMMVVSCIPTVHGDEKWNLKSLEDHAATACAVQNFMLSLASEGVGSKWMTGAMGIPPADVMQLVNADESEHYMGVIFIGLPEKAQALMKAPTRK